MKLLLATIALTITTQKLYSQAGRHLSPFPYHPFEVWREQMFGPEIKQVKQCVRQVFSPSGTRISTHFLDDKGRDTLIIEEAIMSERNSYCLKRIYYDAESGKKATFNYDASGKLDYIDSVEREDIKLEFCCHRKMAKQYDAQNRLSLIYEESDSSEAPKFKLPPNVLDKFFSGPPIVDSIKFWYNRKGKVTKESFIVGDKKTPNHYYETATFRYNLRGLLIRFDFGQTHFRGRYKYK